MVQLQWHNTVVWQMLCHLCDTLCQAMISFDAVCPDLLVNCKKNA